jgi:hypothetical protein
VTARLRVSGIRDGVLFLPFHYGYWDTAGGSAPRDGGRAANELTTTDWDPASKQPLYKTAAAAAERVAAAEGQVASAPTNTASAPVGSDVPPTSGGPQAQVDEKLHHSGTGGVT